MNRTTSPPTPKTPANAAIVNGIYQTDAAADALAIHDRIELIIKHLHSQLLMVSGSGLSHFHSFTKEVQEDYLHGCCVHAQEVKNLMATLGDRMQAATTRELH